MPINYKEHVSLVELEEGIVTMKWMNCKFHSAMCYTQEFDESYHNLMLPERVSKHSSNVAQQNRSTEKIQQILWSQISDCLLPCPQTHYGLLRLFHTPNKISHYKGPKRKIQAKSPGFYFYEGGYKLRRNYASSFQGVTDTRKYLYACM